MGYARRHDRRLEPTLDEIGSDAGWGKRLCHELGLDRVPELERCARLLAEIGESCDASTLAEFADDVSTIDALRWLDTLVLAQAAEREREEGEVGEGGVRLEESLARALA
jgi:hypothetical protein